MSRLVTLLALLGAVPQISLGPDARVVLAWGPAVVAAQSNATLKRAVDAGAALEYPTALRLAKAAIAERLTVADLRIAYQLLGTTYAAVDSGAQAQDAFGQLILLDPEFEFDAATVSPKIITQYALALAQVLVIRHLVPDSATTTFVAGRTVMSFRFVLTQRARIVTRITGPAGSAVLDSSVADPGVVRVNWNGLLAGRVAPTQGRYRLQVQATSTGDQFAAELPLAIRVAPVDTAPHLAHLEGYDTLPTMVVPSRSFRSVGTAALLTGVIGGGALALENSSLGHVSGREVTIGASATMLLGLVAAFGHPVAEPSAANIRYNQLIRDQLARTNQQIADANRVRQQEVQLTVVANPPPVP